MISSHSSKSASRAAAFTLIELLVVIAIIAVLAGLAFPAYQNVQNSAKKAQAKNDLVQMVTGVGAYYTEYGKYPLPASSQGFGEDYTYSYDGAGSPSNAELIKILQNEPSASADNPKGIVFYTGPQAKSAGGYGIQPGNGANPFQFKDPWGRAYSICIDSDYNGRVRERGTGNLIPNPVVTWSLGKSGDWTKSGLGSWK